MGTILDDWVDTSEGFHNSGSSIYDHRSAGNRRTLQLRRTRIKAIKARGGKCENPNCPMPFHKDWGFKVFQFDHIIPLFKIGKTVENNSKSRIKFYRRIIDGEADEVQMLCGNCHLVKTHKDLHTT